MIHSFGFSSILLLFSCVVDEPRSHVSYAEFRIAQKSLEESDYLMRNGKPLEAIPGLRRSVAVYQFARRSAVDLANVYYANNRIDSAHFFSAQAFRLGAQLEAIASGRDEHQLLKIYQQNFPMYQQSIDRVLYQKLEAMIREDQAYRTNSQFRNDLTLQRNQAKIDSANFLELRKIIESRGWPGLKLLGYERPPMISVVAGHALKEDLRFFLLASWKGAEENLASWHDVESLMQSYIYNFTYQEKTRLIEFLDPEDLDKPDIQSNLALNVFVKSLIDNPFNIELVCFDSNQNLCRDKQVNKLKDILIDMGIRNERISFYAGGISDCTCKTIAFIRHFQ